MFIYKITNKINGKVYIGLDSGAIEKAKRWRSHKSRGKKPLSETKRYVMVIHRAMQKYGIENFSYEPMEVCEDHESLLLSEAKWVTHYSSNDPQYGYNRTTGGQPTHWTTLPRDEYINQRKRMSEIHRKLYNSEKAAQLKAGKLALSSEELAAKHKSFIDAAAVANSKSYDVIDPDGDEFRVTNLKKFCREHNLKITNFRAILEHKARHYQGWQCFNLDIYGNRIPNPFVPKNRMTMKWILRSPNGEIVEIRELKPFCRKHNISYHSMIGHYSKNKSYNGWILLERVYFV
jgi:group I intron endonuclease